MFGSKQAKMERLEQIVALLRAHPAGLTQAEIARRLGVSEATIMRDLWLLEQRGILIAEADRRLQLYETVWQ
ncbi:MAG: HTH domain-containing protein [Herpetosiphonaceae bacterium]|nr:MAG: HTH domain-containing protein [Herpetosiphonaceae bacterium]